MSRMVRREQKGLCPPHPLPTAVAMIGKKQFVSNGVFQEIARRMPRMIQPNDVKGITLLGQMHFLNHDMPPTLGLDRVPT